MTRGPRPPGPRPPGRQERQDQVREMQKTQRQLRMSELERLNNDAQELGQQASRMHKTVERLGDINVPHQTTQFKDQAVIWQDAADHAAIERDRAAEAIRAQDELLADREAAYRVNTPQGRFVEDVATRMNEVNRQIDDARTRHQEIQDARNHR